jgi:hypothetical protein
VIDLDATIITASPRKQGASRTYKGSYRFHPLSAWCANTFEALAMMLRPGNAGSNTVSDHREVIAAATCRSRATRATRRGCWPPTSPATCSPTSSSLVLDQERELARAEPETLRAMILHIPARLVHYARARILKIEESWP